jgi:hypothetical protein
MRACWQHATERRVEAAHSEREEKRADRDSHRAGRWMAYAAQGNGGRNRDKQGRHVESVAGTPASSDSVTTEKPAITNALVQRLKANSHVMTNHM